MTRLFLKVVNMSISAGWLILAVLMLRLLLKRAPKWIHVLLWGIVALRLTVPFSVESALSLIPSAETISPEIMTDKVPALHTGIPIVNSTVNPMLSGSLAPDLGASVNPLQVWIPVLAAIWGIVAMGMLAYTAITYLRLRRKVAMAVRMRDQIYQSENVSSPFVLGFVRPKIYLPFKIEERDLEHVIAHELAHVRRRDHWWKPLGFLLLTIHWFNPLAWLAYVILCRDIELACDEKVIRQLGNEQRADYVQALVTCSVNRRMIAACPLAFGEVGVKARVKSVMNYKKPAFWIVVLAVVACGVIAVCFLTNPVTTVRNPWVQEYEPGMGNGLGNVDKEMFERISEDFAIGADRYGRAVFKDPHKAFDTFTVLYAEGIALIREERHLKPISRRNYDLYKVYGWQTASGSEEAREQAAFVSRFLDVYENSFAKEVPAADEKRPAPATTDPLKLSLDDVVILSRKGSDLDWSDFEKYRYFEVSGLHIWRIRIDETFALMISGAKLEEKPTTICLEASDGTYYDSIDVREGGVEEFIALYQDKPSVVKCSAWWQCSPVGYSGELLSEMMRLDGDGTRFLSSSAKALPVVQIQSLEELLIFQEKMSPYAYLDYSPYGDFPAFVTAAEAYDESFFEAYTLFLIYVDEPNTAVRHGVESIEVSNRTLSILVQRSEPEAGDAAMEGWLVAVSIPTDQIPGIEKIDARISLTALDDGEFSSGEIPRRYVFREGIGTDVSLYDNGEFMFCFSPFSSYLGYGSYEVEGDRVTLNTEDGKYVYVFKMVDDTLVFDARSSSQMTWFSNLYDGAIFECR